MIYKALLILALTAAPLAAQVPGKHPPVAPGTAPTPEAMIPFILLAFARHDCTVPVTVGQQRIAIALSEILDVPFPEIREREGVWNQAINTAFDILRERGQTEIDREADRFSIPGCTAQG